MIAKVLKKSEDNLPSRANCASRLCVLVCVIMFVHAIYVTYTQENSYYGFGTFSTKDNSNMGSSPSPRENESLPLIFIYRRTKKTGSSSMLDALLDELVPLGYQPLYYNAKDMLPIVRLTAASFNPDRIFIAQHNSITREHTGHQRTVIADTVRDGYLQMTSYCRHVKSVRTCDEELIRCLKSEESLKQRNYRWAGRPQEDTETYIDIPLSSKHPALSTTMLRKFYPSMTLRVHEYNVKNSSCPETPEIRNVYNELYSTLDDQAQELWKRLLILTGYPVRQDINRSERLTTMDMLDAAERMEQLKYNTDTSKRSNASSKKSDKHTELVQTVLYWTKDGEGRVIMKH